MRHVSSLMALCALAAIGCHREAVAERPGCGLAANLGSLVLPGTAEATAAMGAHADISELAMSAPLSPDLDPPLLQLAASAGHGAFRSGISIGTFAMTPADSDPLSCSFCVTLVGPISERERRPKYTYAATAGTLELTEIGGRIRGRVRDLELREMRYSSQVRRFVDTPAACKTRISSASFDLPLESFLVP